MNIIDIKNLRLQGECHHHWLEAHVGMTEVHLEAVFETGRAGPALIG